METLVLNEKTRSQVPGQFISLSQGVVHYDLQGPQGGKKVVLVHGFIGPMEIWDCTVPAFVEKGYQVLRYNLYGRGFSDRPEGIYDPEFFDRQLVELLDSLGWKEPIYLIGLSMGGAIAVHFIAHHPKRVEKLTLIAPAGFVKNGVALNFASLPGVGEFLFRFWGSKLLRKGVRKAFHEEKNFLSFFQAVERQMHYKGFRRAILSTLRNMPLGTMEETYQKAGASQKPTLLLWGTGDQIVPYPLHQKVLSALPQAEFFSISGASHSPQYDLPEVVHSRIWEFLEKK